MLKINLSIVGLFFVINLLLFISESKSQVIASIPDTTGSKQTSILIPVRVDLKNYDVISYSFEVTFNPDILTPEGVTNEGTITESWNDQFVNTNFTGKLIVSAYTICDTINQKGTLLNLSFDVAGIEGDSTLIEFSDFTFNNGFPRVYKDSGVFKVKKQSTGLQWKVENSKPESIMLYHNYPDPFITTTNISYRVKDNQQVTIKILNILGREIKTLVSNDHVAGDYSLQWDGRDHFDAKVPAGIYFCIMKTERYLKIERITLVK